MPRKRLVRNYVPLETHHMNVKYNPSDRTYTVIMAAEYAHVLIWGGASQDIEKAEGELRRALVMAEDEQMSESDYVELFS